MSSSLGVGLTYSADLLELIHDARDLIGVIEIEPQTMWFASRDPEHPYRVDQVSLERVRELPIPKLMHGIGFPVGGSRVPLPGQYEPLGVMIDALRPPYMSEHLSFNTSARGGVAFNAGFLLPPRQNEAGVDAAVQSVCAMMEGIGMPLAVENGVNYLRPRPDEMRDGEFVANVVERADCGILLDLHNLLTNERNGRQRVDDFLADLPTERVWEIHLAGGEERHGFWVDSHCTGMDDDLIDLAREIIPHLPNLRALIFELFPSYYPQVGKARMLKELETLNELWASVGSRESQVGNRESGIGNRELGIGNRGPTPGEWEDALGSLVVGEAPHTALEQALASDPGVAMVQELLSEFRASMIAATLKLTTRLLLLSLGQARVRQLFAEYWRGEKPQLFASEEGERFGRFLLAHHGDMPYLRDVVSYELAAINGIVHGEYGLVEFSHDPLALLRALGEGRMPTEVKRGEYEVEITPDAAPGAAEALHVQAVAH
jgi:uncharacterized protein (UPF0276 family)